MTGKLLPVQLQAFLIEMLSETISLILDAASGEQITPKDAAILALKKALIVAGLGAETSDAKLLECGVSTASLALTTMDTVELEEA